MRELLRFFKAWEPRAWAALAVVTVGIWTAHVLMEAVEEGATARIDGVLLKLMRQPDDLGRMRGPDWLPEMVRDVTALGSVIVLILSTAGIAGFLWLNRQRSTALFLMAAVLGGGFLVQGMKTMIDRPRPEIVPHLAHVSSQSFPSGHSTMSAVTYLTLGGLVMAVVQGRLLKLYVLGLAVALTMLVGASRVVLGVHYPSDVFAGWTIGLVWSEACWLTHAALSGRLRATPVLKEVVEK